MRTGESISRFKGETKVIDKPLVDLKSETRTISITPLKKATMSIRIKGTTPLLMNKMDVDVLEMLHEMRQNPLKKKEKVPQKPMEDQITAKIHRGVNGEIVYPASAFSDGIQKAALSVGLTKIFIKRHLRILEPNVRIEYKNAANKQIVNESMGRDNSRNRTPLKIIRPEFQNWETEFTVEFDTEQLDAQQIFNLVNRAGFETGIGAWRPENNGSYGMYEVKSNAKD